jgi:hypothetical protein
MKNLILNVTQYVNMELKYINLDNLYLHIKFRDKDPVQFIMDWTGSS